MIWSQFCCYIFIFCVCLQPVAVILCPGWEKVQTVLELLEDSRATQNLHPTSVLLGMDQDEPKKFKIQRNCECVSERCWVWGIWMKTKSFEAVVSAFVMLLKVSCWWQHRLPWWDCWMLSASFSWDCVTWCWTRLMSFIHKHLSRWHERGVHIFFPLIQTKLVPLYIRCL